MNVHFLIMHKISIRNKRHWLNLTVKYSLVDLLGFVGFVVNLLNRPTDGATVHALKGAFEKVHTKKCVRKRLTSCPHGST
jgi:hypothetical protein